MIQKLLICRKINYINMNNHETPEIYKMVSWRNLQIRYRQDCSLPRCNIHFLAIIAENSSNPCLRLKTLNAELRIISSWKESLICPLREYGQTLEDSSCEKT